jgi:ApaG protein
MGWLSPILFGGRVSASHTRRVQGISQSKRCQKKRRLAESQAPLSQLNQNFPYPKDHLLLDKNVDARIIKRFAQTTHGNFQLSRYLNKMKVIRVTIMSYHKTSKSMFSSEAITRKIRVHVEAQYDPGRSSPRQSQWFFLYTVSITNEGNDVVQLVSRHWIITDGMGNVEEVKGPGVIGKQPVLSPGQSFEYTSGCPLTTPFGSMHGTYQMVNQAAENFDIEIAPFTLSEPYTTVN